MRANKRLSELRVAARCALCGQTCAARWREKTGTSQCSVVLSPLSVLSLLSALTPLFASLYSFGEGGLIRTYRSCMESNARIVIEPSTTHSFPQMSRMKASYIVQPLPLPETLRKIQSMLRQWCLTFWSPWDATGAGSTTS